MVLESVINIFFCKIGVSMPFTFDRLDLEGVMLVTPKIMEDDRGFFLETYKASDFYAAGISEIFTQDNHSLSTKNVLRGIHFQNHPHPQGKLVRCIRGSIYDVAVDLRATSTTFGKWVAVELTAENKQMLYIPPGFGHGFSTLSDEAEICYKCTAEYNHNLDAGVIWNDEELAIDWKIENPLISEKDEKLPTLYRYFRNQGY